MISGNREIMTETENAIAKYHGSEAALVYGSGYLANLGLISCIGKRHSVFLYDEHIHASLIDGMRLSFADRFKFRHNDTTQLKTLLEKNKGKRCYILTESVFSMEGDKAPLEEMAALSSEYGAGLIVDEAHALGVFGDKGEGLCPVSINGTEIFARVYTYGKALGRHGAAICGSKTLIEYLINFSRPFIYTTASAPAFFLELKKAYAFLPDVTERKQLQSVICLFRKKAKALNLSGFRISENDSAVQYLLCGNRNKAINLSKLLEDHGISVKAILSPTVAIGSERLRICLHSYNSESEIDKLLDLIRNYH